MGNKYLTIHSVTKCLLNNEQLWSLSERREKTSQQHLFLNYLWVNAEGQRSLREASERWAKPFHFPSLVESLLLECWVYLCSLVFLNRKSHSFWRVKTPQCNLPGRPQSFWVISSQSHTVDIWVPTGRSGFFSTQELLMNSGSLDWKVNETGLKTASYIKK